MSVHKIPRQRTRAGKQWDRCRRTRVWLNGRELKDVVYADARRGVVRRLKRGPDGRLVIDYATGEIYREELRGRVKVSAREKKHD